MPATPPSPDPAPPPGRIHRPDSLSREYLDAVTDVGEEDPAAAGDAAAAHRVWSAVEHWYQAGAQPGIEVCIRHRGVPVVNRAIGHARGNGPADGPGTARELLRTTTPVCVFSAAKALAVTVAHLLIQRGRLDPAQPVAELLPGYGRHGKARTTIDHVLTHRAGVPVITGPRPDLRRSEDSAYTREMLAGLWPVYPPGTLHMYHALTWGPLMREIIAAATGRSIREILAEEILEPVGGFRWTNFGVAEDDVARVAPSYVTGPPTSGVMDAAFTRVVGGSMAKVVSMANKPGFLTGVVPSSNAVSTAAELARFADLWQHGGQLDGVRVLEPATLISATRQRRRLRPDIATGGAPIRWGTGYMLGSERAGPFGRGAPAAFGHTGLTQIAVWADPSRELAVGIISTGKPGPHPEADRYEKLLDTINTAFTRA